MSRIDELIAELCPEGVEFKSLGDFAELVRGNGLPKSVFAESGIGCIHYGQIYTYYGVWTNETISFVAPETAAPLAKVNTGDIIITNTSENVEDVCKAVAWLGDAQIVTGGDATVIKHGQDPKYLSYYFRTPEFFAQKKEARCGNQGHRCIGQEPCKNSHSSAAAPSATRDCESAGHVHQAGGGAGGGAGGASAAVPVLPRRALDVRRTHGR
jgi:hypothetical protein